MCTSSHRRGWPVGRCGRWTELWQRRHDASVSRSPLELDGRPQRCPTVPGLRSLGGWPRARFPAALEIDAGFWDPSHPWNDLECGWDHDAAFSADGSILYLARCSHGQIVDVSACGGVEPPAATVSLSPSERSPGDTVTVHNLSVRQVTAARIWVTEGPSPDGAVLCETSGTLTAPPPESLDCAIPVDLLADEAFWAHVAVETDEFPYPGPGQLASREVTLDRAPETQISYDPSDLIVGSLAGFFADAEHPDEISTASSPEVPAPGRR